MFSKKNTNKNQTDFQLDWRNLQGVLRIAKLAELIEILLRYDTNLFVFQDRKFYKYFYTFDLEIDL